MRDLIDAQDWEKVARETAVFVEDKLRNWATVPASVTGSVNVFKAAISSVGFLLPKPGLPANSEAGNSLPPASLSPFATRTSVLRPQGS